MIPVHGPKLYPWPKPLLFCTAQVLIYLDIIPGIPMNNSIYHTIGLLYLEEDLLLAGRKKYK